jgi:hypothetical protein
MELSKTITGVLTTGTNRVFGEPLWNLGPPLDTFGFTTVAAYNPNGHDPIALTSDMPPSTVLATYVDPAILIMMGMTQDKLDPSTINVPLRNVRVVSDLAGSHRIAVKGVSQTISATEPAQAEPSNPITLKNWCQASGQATIECAEILSKISLDFGGLIPNRLYTVCGMFNNGGQLASGPLGGAPNAFLTDAEGNAKFQRVLNFCPLHPVQGRPFLLYIDILYHSDQMVYGLVPDLTLTGLMGGVISHSQFEFPFAVTPAQQAQGERKTDELE